MIIKNSYVGPTAMSILNHYLVTKFPNQKRFYSIVKGSTKGQKGELIRDRPSNKHVIVPWPIVVLYCLVGKKPVMISWYCIHVFYCIRLSKKY